jgi:TolB-like protein
MAIMRLLLCFFILSLTACSATEDTPPVVSTQSPTPILAPYTVHQYVGDISTQLSKIQGSFKSSSRIAVTSFLMADAVDSGVAQGQMSGLSQQIQESILTQFTQLGYNTIEYRLENSVNLSTHTDSILSRDITKLRQRQNIDYVVTGTLTRQQHAYIVNARLVNVQNLRVMSAATTEIPINVMWSDEKIQQRNGYIYRSDY